MESGFSAARWLLDLDGDEGCNCSPGQTQACFLGPAGSRGLGECKDGLQTCVKGIWSSCEGSGLPIPEQCDGKDNDCDGKTDEPEDLRPPRCQKQVGVCAGSVQRCAGGAGWQPCNDADYQKHNNTYLSNDGEGKDHCDGLDNDCDGKTDEDCSGSDCKSGSVRSCYTGAAATRNKGTCSDGIEACVSGVWSGKCLGQVLPRPEVCDNQDDDCDGQVDNACASSTSEKTPDGVPPDGASSDAGTQDATPELLPDSCQSGATWPETSSWTARATCL